jgi:predicted nucleic acid-binding protein
MAGKRYYLDANVMLSYIDGDEDRLPEIDELFRRGDAGEVELVTSALSMVEVAFASAEKDAAQLDPQIEEAIDKLWEPASPIGITEYHRIIGYQARDLMRQAMTRGWSLKAHDAVHLATAMNQDCDEVFTYDDKLWKFAEIIEMPVGPPKNPQEQLGSNL